MVARYERRLQPPSSSFFLFGMRGVGKTTWARDRFPDAHWIDLLREDVYQSHLVETRLFRRELAHLPPGSWVVVDEIQRLPSLLNEIHSLIEERGLRFVLLGSSARKLRRAGVNLLGGRALQRILSPLLPSEVGHRYCVDEVLRYGSLPLIWNAASREDQLEAYVQLYLKAEIQAEALVRNLPGFARFLPVASLFHGQVLNVEGLARDSGLARSTVQGYLDILEDTLLAFRVRAFEGRLRVKERRHPKLYWLDSGVARAARKQYHAPSPEERGSLFEGLIAQLLRAHQALDRRLYDELYYWAVGKTALEVDFLLQRGDSFTAIEAKARERLDSTAFAGLRAVAELPNVSRRILVYLGDRRLRHETGVEVLPFASFLEELERGL
ncbi:MAG: ATP-binding protein [Candidatus Eisenbacteria bacterium]|uniref:ATP-binding protein n=1 Tax=Eiseniibacteriota bacterium TaxID=2212470 RepID=A0A937XCM6_UNCEI|nr:ATP-binding protein [Candidatus Eisenbacteria bacterium]